MRNLGFIPFIIGGAIAGIGKGIYDSTAAMIIGLAIAAGSLVYLILNDAKKP